MTDPGGGGSGDGIVLEARHHSPHIIEMERTGPATLAEVMTRVEEEAARGETSRYISLPTGFDPLDDILNGGMRRGELLIIGGAFGVGKTIFGLQMARNIVRSNPNARAMYICYEHDRDHLMSRLLCLESAERGDGDQALTLRRLAQMAQDASTGAGLINRLQMTPRYRPVVETMADYGDRLILVKASGDTSTLDDVRRWVNDAARAGTGQLVVVVDYLQKIPVNWATLQPETEVTTHLTQGLKELAMALGVQVVAIAASDRIGLKSKRMRLSDLRGSSALQYEADVGLILNNKWAIVSREHMVYNPGMADAMRGWVVMTVEKNRAGRNAVDMEYRLDAAHFRFITEGRFVRERLVDEKLVLE
ncbi:MAG: DnaB-like helicase C-terminal domain-containing protein [Chloroflexota bacterium]|nr:DnaB-like helicase C-terminal domain-containing protein [Chloroflexota bacterium]